MCHTILVADRLADADARLVVRVLQDHDLGQLDSQTVADIVSVGFAQRGGPLCMR